MLLRRMFLILIPLVGKSLTLWKMPSKISSLVASLPASLELCLYWIPGEGDPKNQGSCAKEVALVQFLPLHPCLQNLNFFLLLSFLFFCCVFFLILNSFQSGMLSTF
jgi:disulfide bond formation protein DsbB